MEGLIFRTQGPWGAGSDDPLTAAERDGNLFGLMSRIVAAETGGSAPVIIDSFAIDGASFTATLTDETVLGPFPLPFEAFRWRGAWEAETAYAARDLVHAGDGLFVVATDHVAAASFDPQARLDGVALYVRLLTIPPAGTLGAVRMVTADHQLTAGDAGALVMVTGGGSVTVPAAATMAFPVGTDIALRQAGAAPLQLIAADGVTLNPVAGRAPATAFEGAMIRLKKVGLDEWDMWGDLASADPETETAP